jgi:hypothetical protein
MDKFGKRVDGIDGRRSAERQTISMPASMFSLEHSRVVTVEDISTSGARLIGEDLPRLGEDVWIKAGPVDAFGTVVRSEEGECGVTFEQPLSAQEEEFIRAEARMMSLTKLTATEREALADWRNGTIN